MSMVSPVLVVTHAVNRTAHENVGVFHLYSNIFNNNILFTPDSFQTKYKSFIYLRKPL